MNSTSDLTLHVSSHYARQSASSRKPNPDSPPDLIETVLSNSAATRTPWRNVSMVNPRERIVNWCSAVSKISIANDARCSNQQVSLNQKPALEQRGFYFSRVDPVSPGRQ